MEVAEQDAIAQRAARLYERSILSGYFPRDAFAAGNGDSYWRGNASGKAGPIEGYMRQGTV